MTNIKKNELSEITTLQYVIGSNCDIRTSWYHGSMGYLYIFCSNYNAVCKIWYISKICCHTCQKTFVDAFKTCFCKFILLPRFIWNDKIVIINAFRKQLPCFMTLFRNVCMYVCDTKIWQPWRHGCVVFLDTLCYRLSCYFSQLKTNGAHSLVTIYLLVICYILPLYYSMPRKKYLA